MSAPYQPYQPFKRRSAGLSALTGHPAHGASLIVVMLLLVVVSILGVSAVQISMMGERATRNDRDLQVAWQAAEAGLVDASFDLEGLPASSTSKRNALFKPGEVDVIKFEVGCGTSSLSQGLCAYNLAGKPAWLAVDFTSNAATAATTEFGTFTDRKFASGDAGVQPARPPRYVIELVENYDSRTKALKDREPVFRVTSMGFGPNLTTQVVLQMLYRN